MIRALRPEDLDQVMQIWLDANLEAHCFLPESYWCDHMEEVRAALLGRAKEGRESLTLHVYRENSPAVRFYQREGFAIRAAEREENTGREEYHMEWHRGGQHLPPRRGEP